MPTDPTRSRHRADECPNPEQREWKGCNAWDRDATCVHCGATFHSYRRVYGGGTCSGTCRVAKHRADVKAAARD